MIDATKHAGLVSLSGFPFEVRTSASTREQAGLLADMLVVHELAHAFHDGVPFVFPRSWLMELFANMALYAFAVAQEPGRRLHFETLPRVALEHGLLKPVARDLRYFEAFYPSIEPLTYAWYQFRFTMMAKGVVDAVGPNALRHLWDAFAVPDERLADVLGGQVHPQAGHWMSSWDDPHPT